MHAYVITAKPSRWQRYARTARVWTVRSLTGVLLATLGLIVFALRTTRALINIAATAAAHAELHTAHRAGLPPLGQLLGAVLTAALITEFAAGFRHGFNQTTA